MKVRLRDVAAALLAGAALIALAPMSASAASTVVIGNGGPFKVTVSPGTIVDVELIGVMSLGQPHPFAVPTSSNRAVLAPLSGSTDAQARTHATFRALAPGSATLSGSGPSGIFCPTPYATPGPGCIAVTPIFFNVSVTVTSGTIGAPQTGGAPASDGAAGGGGAAGWAAGALGVAVAAGLLGRGAVALRRRRRVP